MTSSDRSPPLRIVVADDDRVTSHLVCAMLRKAGFLPEPVLDVPTLFAWCASHPSPAAILLDLHMPGGSGSDSMRRLKADAVVGSVPLIILSGSDASEDQAEALRHGIAAYLVKPIDPRTLLAAVKQALPVD